MTTPTDDHNRLASAIALLEVPPSRSAVRAFRQQSERDDAAWCEPAPGVDRPDVITREPFVYRFGALGIFAFAVVGVLASLMLLSSRIFLAVIAVTVAALVTFSIARRVASARRLDRPDGYWARMLHMMQFVDAAELTYEHSADPRRYAGLLLAPESPSEYVTVIRDFSRNLTAGNLVVDRDEFGGIRRAPSARGILMLEAPAVSLPELVFTAPGSKAKLKGLGLERTELEGDFPVRYTVWHPPGYRRDALHVVQPDLMAALVDGGEGLSLEVIDGCLIVAWPRPLRLWEPRDVAQVWRVAARLREALTRIPASWRDERPIWHDERVGANDIRRRAGLPISS